MSCHRVPLKVCANATGCAETQVEYYGKRGIDEQSYKKGLFFYFILTRFFANIIFFPSFLVLTQVEMLAKRPNTFTPEKAAPTLDVIRKTIPYVFSCSLHSRRSVEGVGP